MDKKNKTAIILVRVSTEKQVEQWNSIQDQERLCRDFCRQNNIDVLHVEPEKWVSWKKADREGIRKIKEFIMNRKWWVDYLVFLKMDRFGRMELWEYERLKKEFSDLWTQLKDVYGVIQEENKMVRNIDGVDMSKYKWNYDDPSKMGQSIQMLWSHQEWKQILQRTIPEEILLSIKWYSVWNPPYGYENIKELAWKKHKILKPKKGEKEVIKKMFELRAEGKSDSTIANEISILWRKKSGKIFEAKDIQRMIINTKYAWVYDGDWTWWRAIWIRCTETIVSIDLFNKANRGKMKIIDLNKENSEWGVKLYEILYKNRESKNDWENEKITKKNIKNIENKDFPYAKLVYSPYGRKLISWSISTGRRGDLSPNYHITIPFDKKELFREDYVFPEVISTKWQYFSRRKDVFEKTINDFLWQIEPIPIFMELYKEYLKQIWNARRVEIQELNEEWKTSIVQLENEAARISRAITRLAELADTDEALKMKNQELIEVKKRIEEVKTEEENNKNLVKKAPNLDDFIKNGIFLLEHIKEAFINAENYNQRKFIFDVIFDRIPYYDELCVGTQVLSPLWAYITENSQNKSESFWADSLWLPELDSNQWPTG